MRAGIILAGGSGKRLWPLSREKKPKQFLKLFMEKSFLESSVERLIPCVDEIFISTGKNLEKQTKAFFPNTKLIVESQRRDTAAAIGLCASKFNENDVLVFVPADAYIKEKKLYEKNINDAINLAQKNDSIVVVGIKPTKPETCYGYIETTGKSKVLSFKEKPSKEKAQEYLEKGFLWNAGIFVCRTKVLMNLFEKHANDIYEQLVKIKNSKNPKTIDDIYTTIRKISFDLAVMEKARDVLFVQASFYWNDVGGFPALSEIIREKNAVMGGKLVEIESKGNVISSQNREKVIALIDCQDLVIIDTNDALLVCPKSSSQKIKKLVEEKIPKELL